MVDSSTFLHLTSLCLVKRVSNGGCNPSPRGVEIRGLQPGLKLATERVLLKGLTGSCFCVARVIPVDLSVRPSACSSSVQYS
jgi:hypothetical protein